MKQGSLVLYSGGLDSAVCLAMEIERNPDNVEALTFDYGQSSAQEIDVAKKLTANWGVPHNILDIKFLAVGADTHVEIPARNTIFLALAMKYAIEKGFRRVVFGAEPDATYIDSSFEYIEAQQKVFEQFGIALVTPIKNFGSKTNILAAAFECGVPLNMVHSCRTSPICFKCKTCGLMLKSFNEIFGEKYGRQIYQCLLEGDLYPKSELKLHPTLAGSNFKYISALFEAARYDEKELTVYTTGNWGEAIKWAFTQLQKDVKIEIVQTDNKLLLSKNVLNTNTKMGLWGAKQVLGHLERSKSKKKYACKVVQGNLRRALLDLGHEFDATSGVQLET